MANEVDYNPCQYLGNGQTRDFSFNWKVIVVDELIVELEAISTGTITRLTRGTDYTANINAVGGNITLTTAPSEDYYINISRKTSNYQSKGYSTSTGFQGSEIEKSFDKVSCCLQDMDYNIETFKTNFSSEVTTEIQENKKDTDQQIQENKIDTDQQIEEFEKEVNQKIQQVNEAVQKLNRLDEVLEECEGYSENAENQATIATQQASNAGISATSASNSLNAVIQEHEEIVSDMQAIRTQTLNEIDTEMTKDFEIAKRYVAESGGKGMPTDICRNLNIRIDSDNRKVYLNWKDPSDTVNEFNQIMSSWKGTIVTVKPDSYPQNYDDGTIILNNTVRNKYYNQSFVYNVPVGVDISTLKFRVFPYSVNDVYNKNSLNCFDVATVYEFVLDNNNSNVNGCISYPEGCVNEHFTPAYMDYTNNVFKGGDWSGTFIMELAKPVMLYNQNALDENDNSLNGQIMEYLNPEDHTLTIDGTPSHISDTSCNANAMVQFKQVWIKIVKIATRKYHFFIANKQVDSDYKCWSHYDKDGNLKEYYYRAMFDGANVGNVIRSIAGLAPCVNVAGNTQIAYAQANGSGYDVDEASFVMMIQALLMLISKSTDTQAKFGAGRNSGGSSSNYNQLTSGQRLKSGQFYGDNSNGCVKVFFMENFWGNVWKIENGIIQKNNKLYLKLTPNTNDGTTATAYNTDGTNYIDTGITLAGTSGGYISGVTMVEGYGLLPDTVSGSSSTFLPDGAWWSASVVGFARFGAVSHGGLLCGVFALSVDAAVSRSLWLFGVSLSYK